MIREAADEYGAGTASWYDAFNGPDHDEDPYEKGYIADDVFHQSREGVAVHAEVLHALGYAPIIPWSHADNRPRPAHNGTYGRCGQCRRAMQIAGYGRLPRGRLG